MDRTVLVVDDDPAIHQAFAILIGTVPGLRLVGSARDGQDAIDQVARLCPDAVICDVEMDPMDGLTALPEIRRRCPGVVVAMYSATLERGVARTLGAAAEFDKTSDDPMKVLDAVAGLLSTAARSRGPVPRQRRGPDGRAADRDRPQETRSRH